MAGCWCARPPALAGLIEVRGVGICRVPYEALAVVGLVVDLAAADAPAHAGRGQAQDANRGNHAAAARGRSRHADRPAAWCWL